MMASDELVKFLFLTQGSLNYYGKCTCAVLLTLRNGVMNDNFGEVFRIKTEAQINLC